MAEAQDSGDQISIPMPWGHPLIARGSMVVLIILILAAGYLSYLWNGERSKEHDEIIMAMNNQACLTKLNLFVLTAPDPQALRLASMPNELWGCLPRFMSEEQQLQRKEKESQR